MASKHEYDWGYHLDEVDAIIRHTVDYGNANYQGTKYADMAPASVAEAHTGLLKGALEESGLRPPNRAERKVIALDSSPNIERACATAAAVCYRKMSPEKVMNERLGSEDIKRLLEHCIDLGHLSTIEHGIIVVGFEGYSRSFLAQLSRHRHLGMDIQSQDYVDHSTARVCVPSQLAELLHNPPNGDQLIGRDMQLLSMLSQNVYRRLLALGVEKDQAREKLLTEVEVRGVVSANPRAWFEFLTKRACDLNGEQIFDFAIRVLDICGILAPTIFAKAGPACVRGRCPEGDRCCEEPWNKYVWVHKNDLPVALLPEDGARRNVGTVDEQVRIRRGEAILYGLEQQAPRKHT